MKVVIDIDDESYKEICLFALSNAEMAIKNGIILPEKHGDLIDRDLCLKMKCTDLVDVDGVTMYAVPTGNILRMKAVIPTDKEGKECK